MMMLTVKFKETQVKENRIGAGRFFIHLFGHGQFVYSSVKLDGAPMTRMRSRKRTTGARRLLLTAITISRCFTCRSVPCCSLLQQVSTTVAAALQTSLLSAGGGGAAGGGGGGGQSGRSGQLRSGKTPKNRSLLLTANIHE